MWPGSFSPSLVAGAVRLGTWVPFERLPALLRLFTGTFLSASTIQRLTETAGAAYEAVQTAEVAQLERDAPVPPAGPPVQQVSVDGAMVPLRGKGEWAEVKTLAIGTVPPPLCTAGTAGEAPAVHAVALSYFSRLADHATFSRLATVETHRRGTETAGTVCGVVDGADWCQHFLDLHRPDAVRILDFPHAVSYLAQIGQAAFGEGTPAAGAWLETQRHALRHTTPQDVLAAVRAVRAALTGRPGAATAQETVGKGRAYLEKRRDQLRYAAFQAQGYPLGSGLVESANKTVVEARLKGAGMHWARAHVNPMLALRTVACSDRWDEAWPQIGHHLRQQRRLRGYQRRATRHRAAAVPALLHAVPPPAPAPVIPAPSTPPAGGAHPPAAPHPWRRFPAATGQLTHRRFSQNAKS